MANKSVIVILSKDAGKQISSTSFPELNDQDITLFIQPPATAGGRNVFKINVTGVDSIYTRKRTSNTIFSCGTDIEKPHLGIFNAGMDNLQVICFESGFNIGPPILEGLKKIIAVADDDQVDTSGIAPYITTFTEGGKFYGSLAQADGTQPGFTEQDYDPATTETATDTTTAVDWNTTTEAGILALIATILPAIVYDGYKPSRIRSKFIKKHDDKNVVAKDLIMCFSAYAHIGNNITKLQKRRVDVNTGAKLQAAVETMGVKKADRSRYGLTLPRIAIAFMPEYLMFRRFWAKDLQSQTASSINVAYKDVAFAGCAAIRAMAGYPEYHEEFATYIFSGKPNDIADPKDEKFIKNHKQWTKVATTGYSSDAEVHARMTTALNMSEATPGAVYRFIYDGITNHYKTE